MTRERAIEILSDIRPSGDIGRAVAELCALSMAIEALEQIGEKKLEQEGDDNGTNRCVEADE